MGAMILAAIWGLVGLASIPFAAMTAFLFDAPGSESSPLTVMLAVSVAILPLFFLAGGILWWASRRRWLFFLLPLLDIAAIVVIVVAIQSRCGGSLVC
jgi:hypothetical protein